MSDIDTWWTTDAKKSSTLEEIWKKCCPEIYSMWSVEHKNVITKMCVGFLIKHYSFLDMTRAFAREKVPGTGSDWRKLRWALIDDCRSNLGIKLLLLRCVAKRVQNMQVKLDQEIATNGLCAADKALYYHLDDMELRNVVIDILGKIPGGSVPSIKTVQKECQQCIVNTLQFISKFVAKKLRFIYDSNKLQHADFVNELQFEIIRKFYMSTPFLSPLHRENTIKRAAHNYGMNLIKYYTNPERSRIVKENGGYTNRIQGFANESYDGAEVNNFEITNHLDTQKGHYEPGFFRAQTAYDNLMELKDYIHYNEKDLPIITLLTLKDDNHFIKWAEGECTNYFASTEEVYEYLNQEAYYEAIAKYLNVPIENVLNTVFALRNRLSLV